MIGFFSDIKLYPEPGRLPFMGTPLFPVVVSGVFALFIFVIGPYIIRRYQLGDQRLRFFTFIWMYYEITANLNVILAIVLGAAMYQFRINLFCSPVEADDGPKREILSLWMWFFMLVKVVELCEASVWFLKNQLDEMKYVSFFHHVTTIPIAWLGVKVVPGGTAVALAFLNCLAHIPMYFYYMQRTIQLGNHFFRRLTKSIVAGHLLLSVVICLYVVSINCGFPLSLAYVLLIYMSIITVGTLYDYIDH